MSVSSATLLESRTSAYLSHYGIRERIAGLQNLSSAKMNQRPKLGSEQGALNVRNWVTAAAKLAATVDQSRSFRSTTANVCARQKLPMKRPGADREKGARESVVQGEMGGGQNHTNLLWSASR